MRAAPPARSDSADYRGGVTCLYDTQLLGACLHASESGGRSRPEAVRGMPDVPIAPPATARRLLVVNPVSSPRVDFAPVLVGVRGPDSDRAGRKLGGG